MGFYPIGMRVSFRLEFLVFCCCSRSQLFPSREKVTRGNNSAESRLMWLFLKLLESPNSALSRSLQSLKNHILKHKVYRSGKVVKFVFLCGGNRESGKISFRREEIIKFVERNLPNIKVFIAEDVFKILAAEGHTGNFLDIEDEISKFADEIIIVLESNGAFCELGAFSVKDLRSKLIVINDEEHKAAPSFINRGPLKAIKEKAGERKIILYKMIKDPTYGVDPIGQTFVQLQRILSSIPSESTAIVNLQTCNPRESFEKDTIRFIHDLIFFSEPITYKELVEMLKRLFGHGDYSPRLQECLGMLNATKLVESKTSKKYYISKLGNTLLSYKFDIGLMISSFRTHYQKHDLNRLNDVKR